MWLRYWILDSIIYGVVLLLLLLLLYYYYYYYHYYYYHYYYTIIICFEYPRKLSSNNYLWFNHSSLILSGNSKNTVYATKSQTLEELRDKIEHYISNFVLAIIQTVDVLLWLLGVYYVRGWTFWTCADLRKNCISLSFRCSEITYQYLYTSAGNSPYIYIYIYEMKWNGMKSLLSLEGLRPPLSRDSSTYTHAMSYFACMVVQ